MAWKSLVPLLLVTVAFAGCADSGTGSASIFVKDAPTDEFDEIHLVYTEVRIHRAANNDTDDDDAGWITLFQNETGQDIDLLATSGDRAAFLGNTELDAGRYTQIRVIVTEAYGIKDGVRTDFAVSAGKVMVVRSFEIEADKETRIILDFDLDRSIVQMGLQGWRMTPVIGKTIVQIVDEGSSDDLEEGEIVEMEGVA